MKTDIREYSSFNLPIQSVSIECHTHNTIAQVSSTLEYENTTESTLECLFVFPLDERSAVYHFEAETEGRVIVAEVQERKEAEETYERAMESNQTAFLLEQDERSDDKFRIRVGNLPSKGKLIIRMRYVVELDVVPTTENTEGSILGLTLPTVLNPRYDPHPDKANFDYDILLTTNPYKFSFVVHIGGSMKIDSVKSGVEGVTYAVQINNADFTHATATLNLNEGNTHKDRDIRLLIHYMENFHPQYIYEKGDSSDTNVFKQMDLVMLSFLPKLTTGDKAEDDTLEDVKNEFIFIIDRSGSMEGSRIQKAKETLLLLLKSLPIGCRFNIIGFGSTHSGVFESPQEYDGDTLKQALEYQKSIDADMGGTEVLDPLKHVYSQSCAAGYARQLFLITDGDVGNTNEVINLVNLNKYNSRVFTVGIGEGASTALVRGVARASGGRSEFVDEEDTNFSAKILKLLVDASRPRFSDVKVEVNVPQNVETLIIPETLDSIFEDQYLNVFLLLKGDLAKLDHEKATVTLSGKVLDRPNSFALEILRTDAAKGSDLLLHRLAARYQMKQLMDKADKKDEIVALSKAFNLISKHTSFVGVDKVSRVPAIPKSHRPPHYEMMYGAPVAMACFRSAAPMAMMDLDQGTNECMYLENAPLPTEADNECYYRDEVYIEPAPPRVSKCVVFADLQEFNGTWQDAEPRLWEALGVDRSDFVSFKPASWSADDFVTLLVIAFLRVKCDEEKGEWSMFAQKAIKLLRKNHSAEVDTLLQTLVEKLH